MDDILSQLNSTHNLSHTTSISIFILLFIHASDFDLKYFILLSQIRDSPRPKGQIPAFISPRDRVAQLHLHAVGSLFVASYDSQAYGGGIRRSLHTGVVLLMSESELLYDPRFTVNQFVLATNPLRLSTSNFIFQLNTCGYASYVTSSPTRGWVCRLKLLLILASEVIFRSYSRGTHGHILLSQIRYSPTLMGQDPYLYPPGTGWHSYTPRHWVPFSSPPTTHRATVEVSENASIRYSVVLM
jgi:hypothetical protein